MQTEISYGWRNTDGGLAPYLLVGKTEQNVAWAALEGGQKAYLSCPMFEALAEGNRGAAKTDALLMDFAQECGKGYGREWRGILFRHTYKQLKDLVNKSLKWFPRIFPGVSFNAGALTWTWPDGETLILSYFRRPEDYNTYHGHAYTWIGWEELTNWPDDKCYRLMFSCCRSSHPAVPRRVRATTNPYGVGHNWVKRRFCLPVLPGRTIGRIVNDSLDREGNLEEPRVAVHFHLGENKVLLAAQPNYLANVKAAARNPSEYRAWVHGDWNIVAGGMFDDVWDDAIHIVPNFPLSRIPKTWYIDRSYDHGQTKPFSVGWWAQSNGEPLIHNGHVYGAVPGDLYRVAEWYGWNGEPNEGLKLTANVIGQGIIDREHDFGIWGRVMPGPADTQIFNDDASGETAVAGDMGALGCNWERCDKSPGSRKLGWERIRKMLLAAATQPREEPGLFILERCEQTRRTLPVLPRDDKDLDDVDTAAEDHIGDESRYRVQHRRRALVMGGF